METVFNEIQHSVKNWWASLLLGIVYIIVALWLMFAPLSSYVALSIVFSISMLISGILEILFAVSNRKGVPSWGWYIVGGIIDVILGIYLIAYPMVSMEVIPFIIAFWLMFRGFSSTGYSIDLKRYGTRDWGWYMAFGILAIICSLLILWQPAIGALYAVYMISFTFLIIGLFRVMLSFELKNCPMMWRLLPNLLKHLMSQINLMFPKIRFCLIIRKKSRIYYHSTKSCMTMQQTVRNT